MKRPHHLGVHHVALYTADLQQSRHFWVELLGYQVEWEPDADNLYLSCGNDNIALHRRPVGALGDGQLDHIGVVVAEAAEVERWERYLRDHGAPILRPAKLHRDGATSCYTRAPEGVVVQIIYHPPISPVLAGL
ncbi:MAG: VOC family protein [Deltaproteobacteria bacterium]|nr:MAG: VOC family protein [Deltaproteobacteria bacterium]